MGLLIPSPGMGPSGLSREPCPFPFSTNNCVPESTIAVGYQSVGIRPLRDWCGARWPPDVSAETSKTATALLSASATNKFVSSRDNASAFGVLPSAGLPGAASLKYRSTLAVRVSTTAIWSVPPRAANNFEPALFVRSADGCRPTAIRRSKNNVPSERVRRTEIVFPPQAETYTLPFEASSTAYG